MEVSLRKEDYTPLKGIDINYDYTRETSEGRTSNPKYIFLLQIIREKYLLEIKINLSNSCY